MMPTHNLGYRLIEEGALLYIKVSPRASSNSWGALVEGHWKVKLMAPPVDNQANKALIQYLSKKFLIPKKNIIITHGETSKSKVIKLIGVSESLLQERLERV